MGLFVYAYVSSFVRESTVTASSILAAISANLSTEDQQVVLQGLHTLLSRKGVRV